MEGSRISIRLSDTMADRVRQRCMDGGVGMSEWFRGLAERELGLSVGEDKLTRVDKRLQVVEDWVEEMEALRAKRATGVGVHSGVANGPPQDSLSIRRCLPRSEEE